MNRQRLIKPLLALGVIGMLFPYVRLASQMGEMLVQQWEHPRWWLLIAGVLYVVFWCFWIHVRILLTLEKQFGEISNQTTPGGASPD